MPDPTAGAPQRGAVTLSMADALEAALDAIERILDPPPPASGVDPRLETGVGPLDRVLGGVPRGRPTVVATDRPLVAEILTVAVARHCPHPCVLAVPDPVDLARSVLGAQAHVPTAVIEAGILGTADWEAVEEAIVDLVARPVSLSGATGRTVIAHALAAIDAPMLVVVDPDRCTTPTQGWRSLLSTLASDLGIAVVAILTAPDEDSDVAVVSTDRWTDALLVAAPDPVQLIRRETIPVDALHRSLVP